MKIVVTATLLVLFATLPVSAQQTATDQRAQIHSGGLKVWIGASLIGAGALVLPITATNSHSSPNDVATVVGVGFVAVGSGMVRLGAQERRKAPLQPQTTFGVLLGRTNGVQIRRLW